MPTPIVLGGRLYLCSDRGTAVVADARTGERIYQKRIGTGKNSFSASVVAAADRLYWVDEGGEVYVFRAGDEFELLATNSMDESCLATPAIANNALYVRSLSELICVGE